MAILTNFLKLFKWDLTNETDLNSDFNIENSLNQNWDKIDSYLQNLQSTVPTTTETGDNILLDKTMKMKYVKAPIPRGNVLQNGEPMPVNPKEIQSVTGDVEINITNADNTESQTLPLTLGNIELYGTENNQDYIYKENDKWYLYKIFKSFVIDGNSGSFSMPSTNRFNIDGLITDYFKASGVVSYVSDNYKGYGQSDANSGFNSLVSNEDYGFNMGSSTGNTIRFKDTRFTSINDFKSWLNEEQPLIYYESTTPVITEITNTTLINELEDILNTTSYEEQTNISGTSDGANPRFKVEAYQSLKLLLGE